MSDLEPNKKEDPNTLYRPWGYYTTIHGNDNTGYKVKKIGVFTNSRLSLQSHNHRSEHWVIVQGKAKVQVGDDFVELNKNQHVYIPIKTLHRIENIGEEMLIFIETQIGDYLGEDDIGPIPERGTSVGIGRFS